MTDAVDGRCKFDYNVAGSVPTIGSISVAGQGLLNLNNGSSIVHSCNSKAGAPEECKCIDSRLTLQDITQVHKQCCRCL